MNAFFKLLSMYRIGGIRYIGAMLSDKHKGTSKAPALFYDICCNAKVEDYPKILENYYQICMNKKMDMKKPVAFSAKIQWLKLYDNDPLKTVLCDKYLAREWIAAKVGRDHLIPLLGVWKAYDEICFDRLPNSFVLRTNHGSGTNVIVKNKDSFDRIKYKSVFEKWMKINFAFVHGFELQYKDVPVRIIAEQYMSDMDSDSLKDIRVFCFNGEPKQIWIDKYSGTSKHIRSIYDTKWNKLPISCTWPDGGVNSPVSQIV